MVGVGTGKVEWNLLWSILYSPFSRWYVTRRSNLNGGARQRAGRRAALPVPPEDLGWQVARPGLAGLTRGRADALQDDHQLELGGLQLRRGVLVERAVGVDRVHDDGRPGEWRAEVDAGHLHLNAQGERRRWGNSSNKTHGQLVQVVGQHLALARRVLADHEQAQRGGGQVALAHVAHAQHEAEAAVAQRHHGLAREDERLGAVLGPRQLGEHHAHQQRLHHHAVDGLERHGEHHLRAQVRRVPAWPSERAPG